MIIYLVSLCESASLFIAPVTGWLGVVDLVGKLEDIISCNGVHLFFSWANNTGSLLGTVGCVYTESSVV